VHKVRKCITEDALNGTRMKYCVKNINTDFLDREEGVCLCVPLL
jgi:hypothetical protein